MHWTLALISFAVAVLFASLAAQWKLSAGVRVIGLLIGTAWGGQQAYFWFTGDSLPTGLFLVCDGLIFGYLWRSRSHWTDNMIMLIYPALWVGYFTGSGAPLWWFLYWGTITQIILAMPWPLFQKIKGSVDHGGLRKIIWD